VAENDVHLLLRIAAGDEAALMEFHRQYVNLVFSMALHVLREHSAAEEVSQDVFMTIWRRSALFDPGRGSVASWLLTITRRRAIDYYRRHRRAQADSEESLANLAQPAAGPDLDLQNALAALPTEQRHCVQLVYFGGLTHHEVAAKLDIPPGTVKSRLRLALNRLRQAIGDRPGDD
jgi:RNA polymerase sigma factor (sigma-70 family)